MTSSSIRDSQVGDLEDIVSNQPLDLSDDEIDAYLSAYDPDVLEYDQWLTVGAALHHQYLGSEDDGYSRWLHWSERSRKHDPKLMPMKWRSFGKSVRKATIGPVNPDDARAFLEDLAASCREGMRTPVPLPLATVQTWPTGCVRTVTE